MMNAEMEARSAQEIRELARQYCDGEFNKSEYRRRRRDILLRCVSEDFAPLPSEVDEEVRLPAPVAVDRSPALSWLAIAMALAALLVLGVMGFLLFNLE